MQRKPNNVHKARTHRSLDCRKGGWAVGSALGASIAQGLYKEAVKDSNAAPRADSLQYVIDASIDHVVVEPFVTEEQS
jgi:hypothetical protein